MSRTASARRLLALAPSLLALGALCAFPATGADTAGKNRDGNRLFTEGKYPEAEKAYLAAQLEAPGRPELQYNLGNALLKQNKLEPALQSLRQAASKGNRGLQASAWYNAGNTLFQNGRLPEAVQAYAQSLRINPSDRDAKHNLELALQKMQQDRQKQSGGRNGKQDPSKNDKASNNQPAPRQDDSAAKGGGQQTPSAQEEKPGSMSREQALQILDAMQSREMHDKRKVFQEARRKASGRDW